MPPPSGDFMVMCFLQMMGSCLWMSSRLSSPMARWTRRSWRSCFTPSTLITPGQHYYSIPAWVCLPAARSLPERLHEINLHTGNACVCVCVCTFMCSLQHELFLKRTGGCMQLFPLCFCVCVGACLCAFFHSSVHWQPFAPKPITLKYNFTPQLWD